MASRCGASTASESDNLAVFHQSIQSLLDGWTCLQLAIKHGFGGPHSLEKANWMVDAVYNWFQENAGIEPFELEDFLADILDHEFDTIADDGSLNSIASNICTNFQMCKSGHHQAVLEQLQKAPSARIGECVADDAEAMDEDDGMDGAAVQDTNMQAMLGGMRLGQSCDQALGASGSSSNETPGASSSSAAAAAAGPSRQHDAPAEFSNPNDEEDDGWKVVRKSKKK